MSESKAVKLPGELIDLVVEVKGDDDKIGQYLLEVYKEYLELKALANQIRGGGPATRSVKDELLDFMNRMHNDVCSLQARVEVMSHVALGLKTLLQLGEEQATPRS